VDINGNTGPEIKIKKYFSCEGCQWLGNVYGDNQKYSCLHPDVTSNYKDDTEFMYKIFMGNIDNKDLKTPTFCPYLIKKLRLEKLKEING